MIIEKEVRVMEELKLKLKTYITSEPFYARKNEDGSISKFYIALAFPVIYIKEEICGFDSSELRISMEELLAIVEKCNYGKDLLKAFLKSLTQLWIDIITGKAKEEPYDQTFVMLELLCNKVGGIENLKFKHVLDMLKHTS